jgi:hypothetical protein
MQAETRTFWMGFATRLGLASTIMLKENQGVCGMTHASSDEWWKGVREKREINVENEGKERQNGNTSMKHKLLRGEPAGIQKGNSHQWTYSTQSKIWD